MVWLTTPDEVRIRPLLWLGATLLCYIAVTVLHLTVGTGYPPVLVTSIVLICFQLHVIQLFGLVSVPSLFTALLTYPALVPFLADYVFRTDTYTLRAVVYETPEHVRRVLFLLLVFVAVFVFLLRILRDRELRWGVENGRFRVVKNAPAFVALAGVHLLAAYLTTPGPTILTADYATVLSSWYPWAAFAGSLYLGTWTVLYLMSRTESSASWYYRGLVFVSVVGVLWLLLHARRNESMGVMTMLLIDYVVNRQEQSEAVSKKVLQGIVLTGFVGTGFLVGKIRGSGTLLEGSIRDLFIAGGSTGTYVALPGSPHNIFGTTLATVDIFGSRVSFRFGETFLLYLPQAIPTGFYAALDQPFPPLLHGTIGQYYLSYNGGNYVVNTYYANFGEIGILVGAFVLAALVYFSHDQIANHAGTGIRTGIGVILVVAGFRAMWYTQLNWIDSLEGMVAGYVVYVVVTNLVAQTNYRALLNRLIGNSNEA